MPHKSFGQSILKLVRTQKFGTGARGVFHLPDSSSVHTLENDPIEAGTYFLRPDDTGKYRNWVVESALETRYAGLRTDVEVHAGNQLVDSLACILPGLETSLKGVVHSKRAIEKMRKALDRDAIHPKTWVLVISEAF